MPTPPENIHVKPLIWTGYADTHGERSTASGVEDRSYVIYLYQGQYHVRCEFDSGSYLNIGIYDSMDEAKEACQQRHAETVLHILMDFVEFK